jgi:cytochrome P450 PksS
VDFGLELASPEALADPYPLFHRMRRDDPVHYSRSLGAWLVTRHEDVVAAFRDARLSGDRTRSLIDAQLGPDGRGLVPDYERTHRRSLITKEGLEHQRLRRLVLHGFTPARLDAARPAVRRAVDGLLDRAEGAGRLDVVQDFAEPLPTLVICELLGIPAEDRPRLRAWSDARTRFFGLSRGDPAAAARAVNDATLHLEDYFRRLAGERRRRPGDDLLSLLLAAHADGRLTEEEVSAQCQLLLIAGHVTTRDQLGNAVHAFLQHPSQLEALRADPPRMGAAVEEALRYDPSVSFIHRVAEADVAVGGRPVRTGQLVLLGIAAANRDPAVFPDPDRFDMGRAEHRHVAFGSGAHACLGMGLARLELEVALEALFRRFPHLGLDPQVPPRRRGDALLFRGFATLPVRLR